MNSKDRNFLINERNDQEYIFILLNQLYDLLKKYNAPRKNKSKKKPTTTNTKSLNKIVNLQEKISKFLISRNFTPHICQTPLIKADKEESYLIRYAWDSIFRIPDNSDFSGTYIHAKQIAKQINSLNLTSDINLKNYSISDYNLDDSIARQSMKLYPRYNGLKNIIRSQLVQQKIPPEIIKNMNFFDFSDVINNYTKSHNNTLPFEPARSYNLKKFEACYGDEFERIMLNLKYKKEYIDTMREEMQKGICSELFDLNHKTNVSRLREAKEGTINDFSNTLVTFITIHNRLLHFYKGYDVDKNIVFLGGLNPAFQIKRNLDLERQYDLAHPLNQADKFNKKSNNSRGNR